MQVALIYAVSSPVCSLSGFLVGFCLCHFLMVLSSLGIFYLPLSIIIRHFFIFFYHYFDYFYHYYHYSYANVICLS